MSKLSPKPSSEAEDTESSSLHAEQDITIGDIQFVNSGDFKESIRESTKKTEIWTLTVRLESIGKMTPILILNESNWQQWQQSIKDSLSLSQTSAAFLNNPPKVKPIRMWSNWWVAKLRATAPNIHTAPCDPPRVILKQIAQICHAKSHNNLIKIISHFWDFKPDKESSVATFIKEYQKRYQTLRDHSIITSEVRFQMKHTLLHRLTRINSELANHCRKFSFDEIISECLEWSSSENQKFDGKYLSNRPKIRCSFCNIQGHKEEDCRKKKKSQKVQSEIGKQKQILSLDKVISNSNYKLGIGRAHV